MLNEKEQRPAEVKPKSRAEEVREEALAAMRRARKAIVAEAVALRELEKAHINAEQAAADAKAAIEAETAARLEMKQTREKAKQAFLEAERATQLEAKANKIRERKDDRLRNEEARAAEAERSGREPNQAAGDEARREADEAGMAALAALREAEKAREATAAANRAVNEAQSRAVESATRTFAAKEAEASARKGVGQAEHNARKAIDDAQIVLELEISTKKNMDWAIRKLKALNLHHSSAISTGTQAEATLAGLAQTEESGRLLDGVGDTTSDSPPTDVSGLVRLLIASPVDHVSMRRLQEHLENLEGIRVSSVSGSSATGASITISVERPFPLVTWLTEDELVERVAMKGRHIEVTLRPTPEETQVDVVLNKMLGLPSNEATTAPQETAEPDLEDVLGLSHDAPVASD